MVLSTILNLFFIPVLYVILKTILSKFSRKEKVPAGRTDLPPQPTH
jgi:HAE1 family hydrophobic/amphiphilic exporter-1